MYKICVPSQKCFSYQVGKFV